MVQTLAGDCLPVLSYRVESLFCFHVGVFAIFPRKNIAIAHGSEWLGRFQVENCL